MVIGRSNLIYYKFNIYFLVKLVYIINKEIKIELFDNVDLFFDLKDMILVGNRVRIYMYWLFISFVNVFELVRVGFVFIGVDDVVKCF